MLAAKRPDKIQGRPSIVFPAPLFLILGAALVIGLNNCWSLPILSLSKWASVLGDRLLATGCIMTSVGFAVFFSYRTNLRTSLPPSARASRITETGILRFGRDPIYLVLAITCFAVDLQADSAWIPISLPIAILTINTWAFR